MLSGYSDFQLERLAQRWFIEDEKKPRTNYNQPSEPKEADIYDGVEPYEDKEAYIDLCLDYQRLKDEADGNSKEDVHHGRTMASAYLQEIGLTYDPTSKAFRKLGDLFSKALAESVFRRKREWESEPFMPLYPLFTNNTGGVTQPLDEGINITLSALIDEYMQDPETNRGRSTRSNYIIIFRVLTEMLGENCLVSTITREDCKRVRSLLKNMPSNATKKAPGKSIQQAIKLAKENGWPLVSPPTLNTHLSKLSAIMNYAKKERYISYNPAEGLRVHDPVKKKDKRKSFSLEKLQRIFNAPIYTGCQNGERGYNKPGNMRPKNARFWVPVISLYSGIRLNEICQLEIADIDVRDETDVILIREEGEDDEKRVKTEEGIRFVPIHPELKKMGFMEYVAKTKQSGTSRLFPELKKTSKGDYASEFSKWFGHFLKNTGVKEKKIVFHSFRHTYRDAVRDAELPYEGALQLGGWSSNNTDSIYGDGLKASKLYEYICRIEYKGLDLSHIYATEH